MPGDPDPTLPLDPSFLKGAKLLPTLPGQPMAVYVPTSDPATFALIIHWLYW